MGDKRWWMRFAALALCTALAVPQTAVYAMEVNNVEQPQAEEQDSEKEQGFQEEQTPQEEPEPITETSEEEQPQPVDEQFQTEEQEIEATEEPLPATGGQAEDDGFVIDKNGKLEEYTGTAAEVVIPDGVTYIADFAFDGSNSLTKVTIPESVTGIGNETFSSCSKLEEIIVAKGNKKYESYAGCLYNKGCKELLICPRGRQAVELAASMTDIDPDAFLGGSKLEEITVAKGNKEYESYAGCLYNKGCKKLLICPRGRQAIELAASMTDIGDAFSGCSKLTEITVAEGNTAYSSYAGCLYNKECKEILICPSGKQTVEFAASTMSIGDSAFSNCSNLTGIEIPGSVTSIGMDAFCNCSSLVNITIPDSVTSIGMDAFEGTVWLENKRAENPLVIVSHIVIDGEQCDGNVEIPNGVTSISDMAFENCSSLTGVEIPGSVTSIGYDAFSNCSSLKSVTLSEGVTSIGYDAFFDCSSLASIEIPGSVTSIGDMAFRNCSSLVSVTLSEGITSIGYNAFGFCSSLVNVTIPDSMTSIGMDAFEGTVWLENKRAENPLVIVSHIVIDGKQCGENVEIPEGVTSISGGAFSGCSSLASIEIPGSVTSIGMDAFCGCSSLASIEIPESVTSIGSYAFCDCSSLTSIRIPENITGIKEGAFDGCDKLKKVTMPEGVTSIGMNVFFGCSSLTSVAIPESIKSIGYNAFRGCKSLTKMVIPKGAEKIDDGAFMNCSNLENLTILGSETNITRNDMTGPFAGCNKLTIYGLKGSRAQKYANENNIPFSVIGQTGKNISDCKITLSKTSVTYNGKAQKPSVTVKDGSKTLKSGTHYTVAYKNNTNAGTAQVTVKGKGSYKGTVTKKFTINKAAQKFNSYTKTYSKAYGSKGFTLNMKLKTGKGKLSYAPSNKKIVAVNSKGQITIKGTGIATVTVKAAGTDNYKAANAKVTIKVSPAKQAVKSLKAVKGKKLTVGWKKDTRATGYQIQYSTDKQFKKNVQTVKVNKNKTTSKTISKLKAGKKYYVRVRSYKSVKVDGKTQNLYGSWSSVKQSAAIKK